ncbi:MAG: hypothetical protein AAFO07_13615 [Bacteroidota bacterium]
MRRSIFFFLAFTFFSSFQVFGQKPETVLKSPDTWREEIIPFPLGFAPEIDLVGFEDIRFSKGWPDSTKQGFWTYSFVWYVDKTEALTETTLASYFEYYFDGLMQVVNKDDIKIDPTICLFIKTEDGFKGKIRTYDSFFTKDYIVLNLKVKQFNCGEEKQIIRFELSPKAYDHPLWEKFKEVELKINCN